MDPSQGLKRKDAEQDVHSIFKRTEVIGRGKFGIVYKGYHVKTKNVYAIKVLNLDSDADEMDDVQKEVQFLVSLKQIPNVTKYYASYLDNTNLWIIMEYCAGGSLRSLLRPGRIEEKYIGVIMREILIALKYIHMENIIHRDIKAANVLISNDGSVKLCDFGVAAQLNQATLRRQTMAGTPYWMAPEVIMEGIYYDTKVDIWSLGITAYEIATGNPPYCDVEALRAMQLITKSKPPRLEGRNYSAPLKEFIALCLDEDPNERLEADDLLKTKFIKLHKASPTAMLKELVTRYLLYRDKHEKDQQITNGNMNNNNNNNNKKLNDDDADIHRNRLNEDDKTGDENMNDNVNKDDDEEEIGMKWDFDSLSSADYIIENNINLDAITEEANEWMGDPNDQNNYPYQEEDQYSYFHTNNNANMKSYFHGTTMGKNMPTATSSNSTINAPMTHINTTSNNVQSRVVMGTGTQAKFTGTYNTNLNTTRKTETKAPKQLLELFEDDDAIIENEESNMEMPKLISMATTGHLETLNEKQDNAKDISSRPHNNLINGSSFYNQSAPQLHSLAADVANKEYSNSLTTAPTSVEIEIPEELPDITIPSSLSNDVNHLNNKSSNTITKPRSFTVSSTQPKYQSSHSVSRRLTVAGNKQSDNKNGKTGLANITIAAEISRANTSSLPHTTTTTNNTNTTGTSNLNVITNVSQTFKRTPSPSKLSANPNGNSPGRKLGHSPTSLNKAAHPLNTNSANPPPTMKPMTNLSDGKDLLLHPLNNNVSSTTSSSSSDVPSTTSTPLTLTANGIVHDKETSRVNGDFKRNNPNLKLQMPLPTTMSRNKLLDANGNIINNAVSVSGSSIVTNENINQFGFNTSSAQNANISMTPIGEKHMDFSNKVKRSHSVNLKKNSVGNTDENSNNISSSNNSNNNENINNNNNNTNHHGNTNDGNDTNNIGNNNSKQVHPVMNASQVNTNLLASQSTTSFFSSHSTTNLNGSHSVVNMESLNHAVTTNDHVATTNSTSDSNANNISINSTTAVANTTNSNVDSDSGNTGTGPSTTTANTITINKKNNNLNDMLSPTNRNSNHKKSNSINNNVDVFIAPPERMLRLELFQDFDLVDSSRHVDRKPLVLEELSNLLQMFEESLPVVENTLNAQLKNELAREDKLLNR